MTTGSERRWTRLWTWLPALVWLIGSSPASEPGGALVPERLNIGFTKAAFQNVNRNDAEAAMKTFAGIVGRRLGYAVESQTQVFELPSALEAALKVGAINLAVLDVWRYLSMDVQALETPSLTSMEGCKVGKKWIVLTRRGSGLNALADLKGKDIAEFETTNFTLGHVWLETVLLESRTGPHAEFFRRVEMVGKPSSAVLPVFFGKVQACVVDESGFELMKELNPQVGRQLQVVATSEVLVDGVLCLSKSGWSSEGSRDHVIRTLSELHLDPGGRQILTLFKVDRLIPFQDAYLDTVRRLHQRYEQARTEKKL